MTSARETEPFGASGWKDVVPIVRLFGKGGGESLRGDVMGGISACVVMIPSVIAYADLAGLPPGPRALRGARRDARIRGLRQLAASHRRTRRSHHAARRERGRAARGRRSGTRHRTMAAAVARTVLRGRVQRMQNKEGGLNHVEVE